MTVSAIDPSDDAPIPFVLLFAAMLALLGVGLTASGCSQAANVVLPPAKEEELGDEVEKELLADPEVQLYEGEKVNTYIQKLGERAVEAAGEEAPSAIEFEFRVIDDPETVNAFAMPGGQIYFYTGLLKLADTEAEVMSVMSHEVAHVTERHIAERLVATYGLEAVSQAALGEKPGLVGQLAALVVKQGALLSFSRKQEKESDEVGVGFMVDADYDPHGFVNFFAKLRDMQGARLPVWLSSHPLPQERIDRVEELIGSNKYEEARVGESAHSEIRRILENDDQADGGGGMGMDAGVDDAGEADVGVDGD